MHTGSITTVAKPRHFGSQNMAHLEGQRRYLETIQRCCSEGLTIRVPIHRDCDPQLVEEILGRKAVQCFSRALLAPPAPPTVPKPATPQQVPAPSLATTPERNVVAPVTLRSEPTENFTLLPVALRRSPMLIRGVCLSSRFDMNLGSYRNCYILDGVKFPHSLPLRLNHKALNCGSCHSFRQLGNEWHFEAAVSGDTAEGIAAQDKIQSGQIRSVSIGSTILTAELVRAFGVLEHKGWQYEAGDVATRFITRCIADEISLTEDPADKGCWIQIVRD